MNGIALNGTPATTARLLIPAIGVWLADVEIDMPASGKVPTGRATLTIGGDTLLGTVDDVESGRRGLRATVRVVGGGNGWGKTVAAQHFHNDFGVTSALVYTATASAVGETVVDPSPAALGVDYVRAAGAASRVFAATTWHLDAAGVTRVGVRAPSKLADGVQVLGWDPTTRVATLAADAVVWPGASIVDDRLGFGAARVRDVEQTFDASGGRVTAWCETAELVAGEVAGTKLAQALGALARGSVDLPFLRRYSYRVVSQSEFDGRLTLQSISKAGAVPDHLEAIDVWPGVEGVRIKFALGSRVILAFVARELPLPPMPIVVGFDPTNPAALEVSVDTARFAVGEGSMPVALAPPVHAALTALQTTVTALAALWSATPGPIASGGAGDPTAATLMQAAAALATSIEAMTSTRTFTD